MLAYRHAFHAGNHADVLKHVVLGCVLRHLNLKEKGWRFVDTHAGAGGYALHGRYARQKAEFADGIARLWDRRDLPEPVAAHVELVRRFNPNGRLDQYPGSPAIAQMLMRPQDQLRLFELHPTDHRILAAYLGHAPGVEVHAGDGFTGLKGQLPPPTRRGGALLDPSFEGHGDYAKVVATLRDALSRYADGTYLVWYPQVTKLEAAQLPRRLEALAPKGWLHARLTVGRPDAQGFGLAGSGMFVINPPHTLRAQLATTLPWLTDALAQVDEASYVLDERPA
jgi:23S rRNA (adenine2030-N6)-methyltransferase